MKAALLGYALGVLASRISRKPLILHHGCEASVEEGAAAFAVLVHAGLAPSLRGAGGPEEGAAWVEAEGPDLLLLCTGCSPDWAPGVLRGLAERGLGVPVLMGPEALERGPTREALSGGAVARWARGRLYVVSLDRDRGLVVLNRARAQGGRLILEPMFGVLAPGPLLLE